MFCFQTAISVMDFIIQIVIIPLFYRVTFLPLKAWLLIVWASTFSSTVTGLPPRDRILTTKEKKMRGPVRKRIGDDKKKTNLLQIKDIQKCNWGIQSGHCNTTKSELEWIWRKSPMQEILWWNKKKLIFLTHRHIRKGWLLYNVEEMYY